MVKRDCAGGPARRARSGARGAVTRRCHRRPWSGQAESAWRRRAAARVHMAAVMRARARRVFAVAVAVVVVVMAAGGVRMMGFACRRRGWGRGGGMDAQLGLLLCRKRRW